MRKSRNITNTNDECSYRVNRGGSWNHAAQGARVALRNGGVPGYRNDNLGFRLMREITALQRLAEGEKDEKEQ